MFAILCCYTQLPAVGGRVVNKTCLSTTVDIPEIKLKLTEQKFSVTVLSLMAVLEWGTKGG
jgi:hypothetical protein